MRSSRGMGQSGLRILVLSAVLIDAVIWLACLRQAVVDTNLKTQRLHRDLAILATAYAVAGGCALVLAWRHRRLGLAFVLTALPVLIVAAVAAALVSDS